ncbi:MULTISPECIES: DUF2589 domain-containing protein [Ralstonia]|uniref:DUF2589 domain-containing protein n=2 Tax=Ralstonia TaxID=48736 RepID=R0E0X5_RALPI|nr:MULTISPECIES: DUF2589 domain-containing protein [Ralstonia]MEA3272023.1 DUF2589 domain-containing protein [Pseudomonadota bacterium]ENZ75804.1 hypothetical protein OR214_04198 [Ralstonia pickettii OR214]MCM3583157.1 DUF2589 domain-containing protein [Ralstonia pickettii]MDR9386886.1 DUF2589 domain-containing protein [Ralstonia sp. 11b]OYU21081.1 MAG: hypothetical protein CFE42_20785 [Ralstonia sp. PBBBR1]
MFKLFSRRGRDDDRASSAPATPSAPLTSSPSAPPGSSGAAPFSEAASDAPPPSPPGSSPPGGGGGSNSHGHPGLNGLTLDDITRGMQHAAASANQMLAQQYTALLDQFFDADETGTLVAREVELALDSQHRLALPLVSLAMPRGLALDEMTVNMTVRSDIAETLPVHGAATGGVGRFYVSLAPHSKRDTGRDSEHIDIEMKFTALQPPEAVMRLIDEYTNRLVPRPVQSNAAASDGSGTTSTPREKSDEH